MKPCHYVYLLLLSLGRPQLEQYRSDARTDRSRFQQRSSLGGEHPRLSLDLEDLEEEDFNSDSFLERFLKPLLEPSEFFSGRWAGGGWLVWLVLASRQCLELPLNLSPRP